MNKLYTDEEPLPYEYKTLYSDEEPLSIESDEICAICRDKLLDKFTVYQNDQVWNMGSERPVIDNKLNVLGNEKPDVVVMMYCCGKGFHRKCIKTHFETNDFCPMCKTDLQSRLDNNKPVFRNAEVVKSKEIKMKKVTAIKFKVLKF